jgi:hypothetical protein
MEEKRAHNFTIIILVVLLAVAVSLCIIMWLGKSKAEKQAEDYRLHSENLEKELNEIKQAEEVARKKVEQFQNDYNLLVSDMLSDAAIAEDMGNLIKSVWNNAIWKKSDSETDKYTMQDGIFVEEFDDALDNLWNDDEFSKQVSVLMSNQKDIKERMKGMLDVPPGYENAFNALEGMYNSYISLTNIVLRCNGSLNSFSEDFIAADEEMSEMYNAADLYVK